MIDVRSPVQGQLVAWQVQSGQNVKAGDLLVVLEAMKMEHEVRATQSGSVAELFFAAGELVGAQETLLTIKSDQALRQPPKPTPTTVTVPQAKTQLVNSPTTVPPDQPGNAAYLAPDLSNHAPDRHTAPLEPPEESLRADLRRLRARLAYTQDGNRPAAMAKRHALGLRSARQNISELCDAGSFREYGALALAAQRSRRSEQDLIENTPADGMISGIGSINRAQFGAARSSAVVMAYDATVLAGTQGLRNHQKTDRMLALALQQKLPVVLFAEGGGGRPGDVDMPTVAGLHVGTFASFARLNAQVPLLGIAAGRCFAGNAALLGCCDVIIATRTSNIGMGGPAMIEGAGLGAVCAEEIGPSASQSANGVIDILVADEAAAVTAARHYLSFFQGRLKHWSAPDALRLRELLPQNRLRVYDSHTIMTALVDTDTLLELRAGFGTGIHTALARIEGQAVGLLANNPAHLGGAIDASAADKAARFMQLCNAHAIPLISLIDTPGFMVGPSTEAQAQVRHVSRMFIAAAHLRVPFFSVVLRKAYGLGAMAMSAGGFHTPLFTIAWPGAEFGAMGLEGAVRLGFRKELQAQAEGAARQALFDQLLAEQTAKGNALNMASTLEIDAVLDPSETRAWLVTGLQTQRSAPGGAALAIDAW